jgi:hypothetical protein
MHGPKNKIIIVTGIVEAMYNQINSPSEISSNQIQPYYSFGQRALSSDTHNSSDNQ